MNALPDQSSSSIRLVVFDLGRVLVRICDDWQHACREAGFTRQPAALDDERRRRLYEIVCRSEVGALSQAAFAETAAPLLELSPTQVRAMSDAYILGPYPGAPELLHELSSAGIATACLTNTNENHWRLMFDRHSRAFLPLHRLTHRFASHLIGARKPDSRIYAHVEREANVGGEGILFFDDVPENIAAARLCRWHAQWIDPSLDDPVGQIRQALRHHGLPG